MTFDLKHYFENKKELVDKAFKERWLLDPTTDPSTLHKAIQYSLMAPGKRIRPILAMASAEALGLAQEDVLPIAAALEMIHVFSLIHDDLPAMDDDDMRRGQATNHKVYGEAMAILAGDDLAIHAFETLTDLDANKYKPQNIIQVIRAISRATGHYGMIAGQVIDIESEGKTIDLARLKKLHRHKTGALIRIALEAPALLCDAPQDQTDALVKYGEAVGLAFQIADDILDIEGGAELGKDIGSDVERGKSTYPSLMGLDQAKQAAAQALEEALAHIKIFGDKAIPLQHIARFIVERKS